MEKYLEEYSRWVSSEEIQNDKEIYDELMDMRWNDSEIRRVFSSYLKFGTSGLRGVMGAGTDRMNIYTVRKVTQGIANYIRKNFDDPGFLIAYDSRKNSFEFAKAAAEVMAGNGIPVYIFRDMTPVPVFSYAIRNLDVSLGAVITASHNSREYNGYKVYNNLGYQITGDVASDILKEADSVDIFDDIKRIDYEDALRFSICTYVGDNIIDGYYSSVRYTAEHNIKKKAASRIESGNRRILYTPLYGTGYEYVRKLCPDFVIADTQIEHDGDFPTAPYPNPEKPQAFEEAIRIADEKNIDYIIATDPDSDRFGMAVREGEGFRVLTGNEIGILLLNFICETRRLPKHGLVLRSIVSTNMADAVAKKHKLNVSVTLTGFKYIGEKLSGMEDKSTFVFAFEESNGFLEGTYSMDKDGVCTAVIAAQMIQYYGDIMLQLERLYKKYGYYYNTSYEYHGLPEKINEIMEDLRSEPLWEKASVKDYLDGVDGLPEADILEYDLSGGNRVFIRPSGTEPKLKVYIFTTAAAGETAEKDAEKIKEDLKDRIEG